MTRIYFTICTLLMCINCAWAQDNIPTIDPIATYTSSVEGEDETKGFSAPLYGRFEANPENVGGWNEYYEWRFTLESEKEENHEPYLIRYEQDTEYTFTKAGTHRIVCYAIFTQGNDTIAYTDEYWNERGALSVTISDSKLEMPNAFSPNDDKTNDIYKPKKAQSLVEFRAIIFNRWGQKVYEWHDPNGGWDGTWNGKPAKQGVYFVDVTAKGSDGRHYHIRRDVNLIRGFRQTESTSSNTTN